MDERNQQSYVAFFDMLGFKEATKSNLDEAWGALEDMRVSMEETLDLFIKLPNKEIMLRNRERTIATNFSDSILIFTRNNTPEDLHSILFSSTTFFAKSLHRCVPLRGAISYGRFYVNFEKNLFCGMPLITAHQLAEDAQWSGIILDDSIFENYNKSPMTSQGQPEIMKWNIPFKRGKRTVPQERWVLNWPLVHSRNFTTSEPISAELYSKAFESLFKSRYQDWPKDIQRKYDYTVEFINKVLGRSPK